MKSYNKHTVHYPNLKTILIVEKVLRSADTMINREELKRRMPVGIMHQTLNLILDYFEKHGMIIDGRDGILWIYNPSEKIKKAIAKGREI